MNNGAPERVKSDSIPTSANVIDQRYVQRFSPARMAAGDGRGAVFTHLCSSVNIRYMRWCDTLDPENRETMALLQAQQPDHSEGTASSYRVYEIGQDGKVRTSKEVLAASDEAAIQQMRGMQGSGHSFELWDRSRVVIKVPGKSSSGS